MVHVQSPERRGRIRTCTYETRAYIVESGMIYVIDSKSPVEVPGYTFKYAGDSKALEEDRSDHLLWEIQINAGKRENSKID
jgi:hypothetical protein